MRCSSSPRMWSPSVIPAPNLPALAFPSIPLSPQLQCVLYVLRAGRLAGFGMDIPPSCKAPAQQSQGNKISDGRKTIGIPVGGSPSFPSAAHSFSFARDLFCGCHRCPNEGRWCVAAWVSFETHCWCCKDNYFLFLSYQSPLRQTVHHPFHRFLPFQMCPTNAALLSRKLPSSCRYMR